jgi:polyphosphate kinase
MPRNLDRRIELMTPIEGKAVKNRLIEILEVCLRDNVKGRSLKPDGRYEVDGSGSGRRRAYRSQEVLYRLTCRRVREAQQSKRTVFEPHRPPDASAS